MADAYNIKPQAEMKVNMNNIKLKQIIIDVLKADERLWNEDKTELNQTLLLDLVENIDEKLIELLLQEKELRDKFFVKIKDVYVFKTNDFRFFMEENKVDNSYTQYKNRIGLTDGKRFLKDTNDVVLNWPYKDCVLEGGQSTEEGSDTYFEYSEKTKQYETKQGKRKEIFFNQVLAADEIDRLFDHKALTNWKRFTKDGEQKVKEIKRDDDGTIKENLIIKGNNLLALHSLKKQFAGKVKLIYIDPPYNTGNDGFKYNDNFNHSTWLTFMKNRLEVARELLRDDGVIFVSCDDNEQAYLKVLMDEVFGRENFVQTGVLNRSSEIATAHTIQKHEYFIVFSRKIQQFKINSIEKYTISRGTVGNKDQSMPVITFPKGLRCINIKDGIYKETRKIEGSLENIENLDPIVVKNGFLQEDVRLKARWRSSNDMRNFFENKCLPTKAKINGVIEEIYFDNDRFIPQIKKRTFEKMSSLILENKRGSKDLEEIGMKNIFAFPKSEIFLKIIIEISTQPNDIVLDYHLGSGTTAAVAHKMGRQYIGIEQMDYIETIACERLRKVIQGEQGGISKSVNWQGGGDFIYFELAKWNETAKEKILDCESLEELEAFFDEMYERYFLNYNLKIKEFKEKVLQEENFRNLSLDEQKKIFVAMLDNNQMYVNKTEMADKKFGISEEDQNLTNQFYNSEK